MKFIVAFTDSDTWQVDELEVEGTTVFPMSYLDDETLDYVNEGDLDMDHLCHLKVPSITIATMIRTLKAHGLWDPMIAKALSDLEEEDEPKFFHNGPLPEGYEIHSNDETAQAVLLGNKWRGPMRSKSQWGYVIADAWKHVTGSKEMPRVEEV
jgi:hypothetical protein